MRAVLLSEWRGSDEEGGAGEGVWRDIPARGEGMSQGT